MRYLFILGFSVVALACSHSKLPTGKAMLSGKFSGSFPIEKTFDVKVTIPNFVEGISKQMDEYETQLETDGSFSLPMPLFCPVYGLFSVNNEDLGALYLSPE